MCMRSNSKGSVRISLIDSEFRRRYSKESGLLESRSSELKDFRLKNTRNLSVFDRKKNFATSRKELLKSMVQNGKEQPIIPNVQYIPGTFSYKTNLKFNLQKQFNKFLEQPTLYKNDEEIIELSARKIFPKKGNQSYQKSHQKNMVLNNLRKLGLQQKMYLRIMEAKIHEPDSSYEIKNVIYRLQTYLREHVSPNSRFRSSIDDVKFMYFNLIDYRPSDAPYVPIILRQLANAIESFAHTTNRWNIVYVTEESTIAECVFILKKIFDEKLPNEKTKKLFSQLSIGKLSNLMLLFFRFLKCKPLILKKEHLLELVKRPLYDNYFHPNPALKTYLSDSMLRCSRTCVDTLSFMMIHITHVWEYSVTQAKCRKRLANTFGPLIMQLEERPVVIPRQKKLVECAILEAIMDQCDQTFWNNLGSHLTISLFDHHNSWDLLSKKQSAVLRYVDDYARNYLRPIDGVLNCKKTQHPMMKQYIDRAKRQLAYDSTSFHLYQDLNEEF